jgi:hypothetical protein
MSSFSCPHIDPNSFCLRLKTDCIPGRSGCVLNKKVAFAIPAEQRIVEREKEKLAQEKNRLKK